MKEYDLESNELWVGGVPATFATKGEKPWKESLINTLISYDRGNYCGLEMKFYLPTLAPNGHPLDVDNLCEPVFSVITGQLGWFLGKRQNLHWWCATKEEGKLTGLRIVQRECVPFNWDEKLGEPIFDSIYCGDLPRKATDPAVPLWISHQKMNSPRNEEKFILRLLFSNVKVNIGDIATGRVKNLIDCLYPIIGGSSGNPDDWRIESILVQKGVSALPKESVRVSIWGNRDSV